MIDAGDVVMVVKPTACCGATGKLGYTFRVAQIRVSTAMRCLVCFRTSEIPAVACEEGAPWVWPVERLKKLPPLTPDEVTDELVALTLDKRRRWSQAA